MESFRKCDRKGFSKVFSDFIIIHGCGHSFHTKCLPCGEIACLICKDEITESLKSLRAKVCEGLRHQDENAADGGDIDPHSDDSTNSEDVGFENTSTKHQMDKEANQDQIILRLKQEIFRWGLIPGPQY